ncbi:MAG TPA: PepSY domain-containing protein [Steroidobacter sp.]|nr:PepSY domain-containing protein [Steroidobacter sp.]
MKQTTVRCCTAAALLLISSVAGAHGDVSCSEPKAEWKPRVELQKKLKGDGWTVRKIEIMNGCYEVYGFDEKDAKVEAFFNPKTFERIVTAG